MAKRRKHYVTQFPNHHFVVDDKSRALALKCGSVRYGYRLLGRIANKLFRKLGEHHLVLDIDGDVIAADLHTVVDDRVPVEQIGYSSALRPTWHGKA